MRVGKDKAKAAILNVLCEAGRNMGAAQITSALMRMGIDLQPRTVRYYLMQLDEQGFTRLVSRREGREVTPQGRDEAEHANVIERVGVVAARIDTLGYQMAFDPETGTGTVIVNISLLDAADVPSALNDIQLVVDAGLTVGAKLVIFHEGERFGRMIVPEGTCAIGTICSVTLNGILQKQGIPVLSRFGGLLEIKNRRLLRFVDMIEYAGSTLDPLEVFIRANMTRVRNVVLRGSGVVCASFREVPAAAADHLKQIQRRMIKQGLGGIMAIGLPNHALFGVPVSEGHCGLVVAGGLNSIAALHEAGVRVSIRSLAGLLDYDGLTDVPNAKRALRRAP